MKKSAIVFGAGGQGGSYMVELLLQKEYFITPISTDRFDLTQPEWQWRFKHLLKEAHPDEIYNFAALMYAPDSWKAPMEYMTVNGTAVLYMLHHILNECPKARFFQAGSAEMFDKDSVVQYEDTAKRPANPYGAAKHLAYELVRIYREHQGLYACTGILFNAESPRRKKSFFSQKVISEAVRIRREFDATAHWKPMQLGDLRARRDWGWMPEYVEVCWQMLQKEEPMDFVIGTGESHTCHEFVAQALHEAGLPDVDRKFDEYVLHDNNPEHLRGDTMRASSHYAQRFLGWKAKYKMEDVVKMLVEAEMKVEAEVLVK